MMQLLNRGTSPLPEGLSEKLARVYFLFLRRMNLDPETEVEVAVLEAEEMRELNLEHRGRDEATDVLSFPMDPIPAEKFLGAVYLCHSIIRLKYEDVSFGFCYLFAHSLLHLIGYDHCEEMFRIQEEIVEEVCGKWERT